MNTRLVQKGVLDRTASRMRCAPKQAGGAIYSLAIASRPRGGNAARQFAIKPLHEVAA